MVTSGSYVVGTFEWFRVVSSGYGWFRDGFEWITCSFEKIRMGGFEWLRVVFEQFRVIYEWF